MKEIHTYSAELLNRLVGKIPEKEYYIVLDQALKLEKEFFLSHNKDYASD